MNKLLLVAAAGLSIAALSSPASAADGTITINGKIVASTCSVNTADKNLTVTLPTVGANTLAGIGSTAGNRAFAIRLTCTGATSSVGLYFEPGTNIDASTNNLKIATGGTNATGVQVRLLNADLSPITLSDSANSQRISATVAGPNVLNYYAQYISTAATVGAGDVTTSVTYNLQYN